MKLCSYSVLVSAALAFTALPAPYASAKKANDAPSSFISVLQEAHAHRPEVIACRHTLDASLQEIRQAAAAFLPSASAAWQRGERRQTGGDASFENRELTANLPVFRGGQSVYGYKGAKLVYEQRRQRCRDTEQSVLNDAAQAYIGLAFRETVLAYFKTNEATLSRQAARVRRLADAGQAVRTDILLSVAEAAAAAAEYEDAKRAAAVARKTLFHLSGVDVVDAALPADDIPDIPSEAELEKALLSDNPDLLAARALADAGAYAVRARKSAFLPTADIAFNKSEQQSPLFFNGDLEFETYTFNVNVPLFAGGGNVAAYKREKSLSKANAQDVAALEISLQNTLAEQTQAFSGARRALHARKKGVTAADAALKGIRREYKEGLRPLTDALQAEKDLLQQRRIEADERRRLAASYYHVLTLTGRMTPKKFGISSDYPEYDTFFPESLLRN